MESRRFFFHGSHGNKNIDHLKMIQNKTWKLMDTNGWNLKKALGKGNKTSTQTINFGGAAVSFGGCNDSIEHDGKVGLPS